VRPLSNGRDGPRRLLVARRQGRHGVEAADADGVMVASQPPANIASQSPR